MLFDVDVTVDREIAHPVQARILGRDMRTGKRVVSAEVGDQLGTRRIQRLRGSEHLPIGRLRHEVAIAEPPQVLAARAVVRQMKRPRLGIGRPARRIGRPAGDRFGSRGLFDRRPTLRPAGVQQGTFGMVIVVNGQLQEPAACSDRSYEESRFCRRRDTRCPAGFRSSRSASRCSA